MLMFLKDISYAQQFWICLCFLNVKYSKNCDIIDLIFLLI